MANFVSGYSSIKKNLSKFSHHNKKISKIDDKVIIYKPSQSILGSLIKFHKKKYNIEDFSLNSVWKNSAVKL